MVKGSVEGLIWTSGRLGCRPVSKGGRATVICSHCTLTLSTTGLRTRESRNAATEHIGASPTNDSIPNSLYNNDLRDDGPGNWGPECSGLGNDIQVPLMATTATRGPPSRRRPPGTPRSGRRRCSGRVARTRASRRSSRISRCRRRRPPSPLEGGTPAFPPATEHPRRVLRVLLGIVDHPSPAPGARPPLPRPARPARRPGAPPSPSP